MILLYDLSKDDRFSSVVEQQSDTISVSYTYKNIPKYLRSLNNDERAHSAKITVTFNVKYPEKQAEQQNTKINPGDFVRMGNLVCRIGIPKRDLMWIGQQILSVKYPAYVNKVNRNLIYFDKGTSYAVYRIFKNRQKFLLEKEISKEEVNKHSLIPFDINRINGDSALQVSYEEDEFALTPNGGGATLSLPIVARSPNMAIELYDENGNIVYQNIHRIDSIDKDNYIQIVYVPDTVYSGFHALGDVMVSGGNYAIFIIHADDPTDTDVIKISPLFLAKIFLNEDNSIWEKYNTGDTYHILGASDTVKYGVGSLLLTGQVCFGDATGQFKKFVKSNDVDNLAKLLSAWAYLVNKDGATGDLRQLAFHDFINKFVEEKTNGTNK